MNTNSLPSWDNRFWAKVDKQNDCWLWTGYCGAIGYGRFYLKGGPKLAHIVSYQIANRSNYFTPYEMKEIGQLIARIHKRRNNDKTTKIMG